MTVPNIPPNKFVSVLYSCTAYGQAPALAAAAAPAEGPVTPWTMIEPVNVSNVYDDGADAVFVLTQPIPLVLAEVSAHSTANALTAGTDAKTLPYATRLILDADDNVTAVRVINCVSDGYYRASVCALNVGW